MPSTVRDRTKEFFATINSFQTFNTIETVSNASKKKSFNDNDTTSPQYVEQSQRIHDLTLKIDANISNIAQKKLMHIEQLSTRSNNLNNLQSDINLLIIDVNEDLSHIDQNISYLSTVINNLDYWNNENCESHHKILLNQLIKKNEKLKSLYRSTYEIVINSMQRNKKQIQQFGTIKRPKNRLNRRKSLYKRRLLDEDQDNNDGNQYQQQEQLQVAITMNNSSYYEDRLADVIRCETELTEISQMAAHLAELVHDQAPTLEGIYENVNVANLHLDGVIANLQKYLARMGSNEWLMIKVFSLIIFLAIFFAIFVA